MAAIETKAILMNFIHRRSFAAAPAPTFIRFDRMNGTVLRLPLLEFLLV